MQKIAQPKRYKLMLYPSFVRKIYTKRTLAVVDHLSEVTQEGARLYRIITIDGEVFSASTFEEFKKAIFDNNLLTFVGRMSDFPFLSELVQSGVVYCTENGKPICGFIRSKGTRWIVSAQMWDDIPNKEFLDHMSQLYEHCQVGTPPTKSSIANAIYEKVLHERYGKEWIHHRHRRPVHVTARSVEFLSKGAIIDQVVRDGTRVGVVDVLDRTSAYAYAVSRGLPTGRHYYSPYGTTTDAKWYIAIQPSITKPSGETTSPPHLASTEIEYFRNKGYSISFSESYNWMEWTEDATPFVLHMEHLRNTAPNDWVRDKIKQLTVAWSGSKGQKSAKTILVPGGQEEVGDKAVVVYNHLDETIAVLNMFMHRKYNPNPSNMPHWYYAIVSQARVDTMEMQDEFRDTLLATDTDCIYVVANETSSAYDLKGSRTFHTGDITRKRIYEVEFERNRWMSWYEEDGSFHTKRPGDPLEDNPSRESRLLTAV